MFDKILHTIAKGVITVGVAVSSLFGAPTQNNTVPAENVGATIPVVVAVFQTSLQTGITATATSMTLVTGTDKAGNSLSGYICFNIDEGTSVEEFVCGTVSGTAVTSMIRGIDPVNGSLEVTALKKVHRRGASVKVTNYPSLGIVSRVLNGTDTIPNAITYASGVGPVSSNDLADKEYVLSVVSGGAVSFEKVVVTGTAGETVVAGNLVYLKSSDMRWWKTDADTASTVENVILGIAQGSGTAGNTIGSGVLIRGTDTNQSGLTTNTVYYASNTAGALSSTVGTKTVGIGVSLSTTSISFSPRFNQQLTQDQINAMGGSQGVPSSTNKFVTQDNLSESTTDQTQTTQNATVAFGETNSAGNKYTISQSFIPTKTKIRGVNLYKVANTGTFTGTVTISIKADSGGSPTGADLASLTLTNNQWEAKSVGEFEALFSAEYSMTAGSLYWIVATSSTGDSANHPNLGTNSAGAYANGSVKYNNTTDGYVAISTIDLYFKTIEGINSQVVKTNSSGKIDNDFISVSSLSNTQGLVPQVTPIIGTTTTSTMYAAASNITGTVLIFTLSSTLYRFEKNTTTGLFEYTTSAAGVAGQYAGLVIIGDYVYQIYDGGNNLAAQRFDLATLLNSTVMTVPVVDTAGSNYETGTWGDGQNAYVVTAKSGTTGRKWSVSGTTFTAVSTSAVDATFSTSANGNTSLFDGSTVYFLANFTGEQGAGATNKLWKFTAIDGSSTTATNINVPLFSGSSITGGGAILINIDSTRMYAGRLYFASDPTTTVKTGLHLYPITKS